MDAATESRQGNVIRRETVAAKTSWSARLEPGQTLKMIDTMGQQAIDFLCYSAELPLDRINLPNTVKLNNQAIAEDQPVQLALGDLHRYRTIWVDMRSTTSDPRSRCADAWRKWLGHVARHSLRH